jgi:hypothetical protein
MAEGTNMIWLDVLLKYWAHLSAEMQEKACRYYHLRTVAEQIGGQFLPQRVQQLEHELQAEARKLGWTG